jgi:hypothetical protein
MPPAIARPRLSRSRAAAGLAGGIREGIIADARLAKPFAIERLCAVITRRTALRKHHDASP